MHKTDTPEKVASTDELGHFPWAADVEAWIEVSDADEILRDITKYTLAEVARAVAADRERICLALPGGYSVDPQWVADMVRDGPLCGEPDTSEPLP